ncbi:MAG: MBL fold metallo-hydrolase [marine bacterium B5-7]|nr:MAG: MBL fold metallo-hydrolase [marine bacterium B5-7]
MATLEFHGATSQVTGSCHLLRTARGNILLECGLFQGGDVNERQNRDPFPFAIEDIDVVVLSHAHIDHSGRLPLLVQRGYRGEVFTHRATAELCDIMLQDSAYIHEKDAEWINRRISRGNGPPVEPLYTRDDARAVQSLFELLDYQQRMEILPGVEICLYDAGHILGSAIVELTVAENGTSRRLVFSGDLGHKGAPILRDPHTLRSADLVLMESTYGDRLHRPWSSTWDELGKILTNARAARGNILIPAFAVGRTQELLYLLSKNYDAWGIGNWQIFLDSPMAIHATNIYQQNEDIFDKQAGILQQETGTLFNLDNLHLTDTTEQSMAINQISSGAIIIAGSGMCTGGRIRHHLRNNIERRQSHVVIVGFQAFGTTGRALVDGATRIRLMGREYDVRAQIHTIGGLSAHADQQGLIDWYSGFIDRPPVALVHGEPRAMDALSERLTSELHAEVIRGRKGHKIEL